MDPAPSEPITTTTQVPPGHYTSRRGALLVLVLTTFTGLALQYWYWTRLPTRVATHFGAAGKPDGWMDKSSAAALTILLQVGLPLLLIGITAATRYLPPQLVNIPHRQYWLSAPHREATLAYLNRMIAWIAVLYALFFIALNQLTFMANINGTGLDMTWFLTMLISFLTSLFTLVGFILMRFKKPAAVN